MQIAMNYRMDEVKGWQKIQEDLLSEMRNAGLEENEIWSKNAGEINALFFSSLNNLQHISATTDSAERSNLISLALFSYKTVKQAGLLEQMKAKCNSFQLASLQMIESIKE
jgi:hypothetical protein